MAVTREDLLHVASLARPSTVRTASRVSVSRMASPG